jgi:excisionase family DNA binding protein
MNAVTDTRPLEPISVKIPEAVRLTGLSRSRIYELMRSGDIEFAKVGSSTLILLESLRGFVNGARREVAQEDAAQLRRR